MNGYSCLLLLAIYEGHRELSQIKPCDSSSKFGVNTTCFMSRTQKIQIEMRQLLLLLWNAPPVLFFFSGCCWRTLQTKFPSLWRLQSSDRCWPSSPHKLGSTLSYWGRSLTSKIVCINYHQVCEFQKWSPKKDYEQCLWDTQKQLNTC